MSEKFQNPPGGPVEALLFDLGGVLIDIDFERVYAAWAPYSSLPLDELRRRFVVDTAYERHERGELDGAGYFAHLRDWLCLDAGDDEIACGWNAVFVGQIEESLALLRAARRQLPCYCFTNTNPTHQLTWSAGYPAVVEAFDGIFVSSELGLRKPEARAFGEVARRMRQAPQSILFFDDLRQNVEAARALGMQAVQVRGSHDIRTALDRLGVGTGPAAARD